MAYQYNLDSYMDLNVSLQSSMSTSLFIGIIH